MRREIHETLTGNATKYYINGQTVLKRQYDAAVEKITHGGGELILNPFGFFGLTSKQQRDFVTRTFGASGREILSLPAEFGGKSAEMVIAECKSEHKRLKTLAEQIPARLEELERQQSQAPTETAEKLSAQIELKRAEQKCAERIASLNDEIASLEEKLLKVKSAQAKELASQERTLNEQLAELEGKQLRAEKYQHKRLKAFEARINDWFEHRLAAQSVSGFFIDNIKMQSYNQS